MWIAGKGYRLRPTDFARNSRLSAARQDTRGPASPVLAARRNQSRRLVCGHDRFRHVLVLLCELALATTARQADAQSIRPFKDWLAACDNRRACTVFGFESKDDPSGAYVRIIRSGAADAAPTVDFNFSVDVGVKASRLRLSLQGATAGHLPPEALPAPDGRAALSAGQVAPFLQSLGSATHLQIALLIGSKQTDERDLSLAGAMAALRSIDALQQRAGGVTALVATGPAPASAVPPVPPMPMVQAVRMSQIAAPLPTLPKGVAPSDDCTSGAGGDSALIAFRLDNGRTLWGACDSWGAYNQDYRFYVADHDVATMLPVSGYDVPGEKPRPDSRGILTSPGLDKDGLTISATMKDEGVGDCGVATDWAWDGKTLRLVAMQAMPVCRGVSIDSWPQLYSAEAR